MIIYLNNLHVCCKTGRIVNPEWNVRKIKGTNLNASLITNTKWFDWNHCSWWTWSLFLWAHFFFVFANFSLFGVYIFFIQHLQWIFVSHTNYTHCVRWASRLFFLLFLYAFFFLFCLHILDTNWCSAKNASHNEHTNNNNHPQKCHTTNEFENKTNEQCWILFR